MAEIPPELRSYKPETREKIRRGLAAVLESAAREAGTSMLTAEKVRLAAAADSNACSRFFKAWRAGTISVVDPWIDPTAAPSKSTGADDEHTLRQRLMESIRTAATDGDRESIAQELAALVAGEVIEPEAAAQIKGALAEARMSAEKKREQEPPPEDPRKLLLASAQAMDAARALDLIVDDARFDRVLAFIAAEVEADKIQHPNEDEGGA